MGSSPEIFRLDLEQGTFMASIPAHCAELNKVSELGAIVKYLPDSFGTPHMSCSTRIRLAEFCIVVI